MSNPPPSPLKQAMTLLDRCAQQFRKYEASHRAKADPTSPKWVGHTLLGDTVEKAEVNAALAAEIEAFLAPPTDLGELGATDEPRERLHGDAIPLGMIAIATPRGLVWANDGPGFMTTMIDAPGGYRRVGIVIYDPEQADGQPYGIGFIHQLDGDAARSMAASLCRLADLSDGRKPN